MQYDYLSDEFESFSSQQREVNKEEIFYKKRIQPYNPDQILMLDFNPGKTFPEGTFERFLVNMLIDMDLSDFEYSQGLDKGGSEEHNPRALLGIIFYGNSLSVFSSRKMADLCIFDYRYMFVSGGASPDHSTISRFVNRYPEAIKNVFTKVLYVAENLGLRGYNQEAIDGSKMRASAGNKFTGTIEDFEKRKEKFTEAFNAQISACEKNGIITGNSVSDRVQDSLVFQEMVETSLANVSEEKKEDAQKIKWTADNGYYSAENVLYCEDKGIDGYISDKQDKEIYLNENKEIVLDNNCRVEKTDNGLQLYCKGGKELEFLNERSNQGDQYYIYRMKNESDCEGCALYPECRGNKKSPGKEFWVKKIILDNIDVIQGMKMKMRTEEGKMIYSRRMPTIEKIFGYFKEVLRLKSFRVRGMKKVKVQWSLLCTLYNLKRIFNLNFNV